MKPICVIYFPTEYSSMGGMRPNWIYEYMAFLNGEPVEEYKWSSADRFKDYCWFCFYKDSINEPEFKVFHEKDFTEIQYQELKQLVMDNLDIEEPVYIHTKDCKDFANTIQPLDERESEVPVNIGDDEAFNEIQEILKNKLIHK